MSIALQAFMTGYLEKTADMEDIIGAGTSTAAYVGNKAYMIALLLPIVSGAMAGAVASKLTSPVGERNKVQKSLVAAELEEAAAELQRKRTLDMANEAGKNGENYPEKALHIR